MRTLEEVLAEKARLEGERVRAVEAHRAAVAPLTAEHFRLAREAQIVARLRNNQEPKPAELEYLAGLSDEQVADLEARAAASAEAAKKKNPAWHPLRSRRKYDLRGLVAKARARN